MHKRRSWRKIKTTQSQTPGEDARRCRTWSKIRCSVWCLESTEPVIKGQLAWTSITPTATVQSTWCPACQTDQRYQGWGCCINPLFFCLFLCAKFYSAKGIRMLAWGLGWRAIGVPRASRWMMMMMMMMMHDWWMILGRPTIRTGFCMGRWNGRKLSRSWRAQLIKD